MATYTDEEFVGKTILLDGNRYLNCKFKDCIVVYEGGNLPEIRGGSFNDCKWTFSAAAERTLAFLANLYQAGAVSLVESTFDEIRGVKKHGSSS